MGFPIPSRDVLVKLGSLAVHADEVIGPGAHPVDAEAIKSLLADPDVQEWLARMNALALLPVKR